METQMVLQSWRAIHFPVGWEEGQLYFPSSLGFLSDSGQHHESILGSLDLTGPTFMFSRPSHLPDWISPVLSL